MSEIKKTETEPAVTSGFVSTEGMNMQNLKPTSKLVA